MLKARLPGILGAFPPLRRLYGRLPTRRRAPGVTATLLAAALLSTGLVTVLLGPSGSAQAQDSEPPTVPNLRCIAETERVAFLWDVPEWSGGEVDSYDYRLTLPEGRSEGGRLGGSITLVLRPGSYQSGKAAQFRITANYETDDGRDVSSAEATLTCYIGGARPLVIAPGNITRVYGGTDAMSYTVSGLVDGDAAVDVLSGRLGRAPGDDVGSYAIDLGTLGLTPAYATKYALPDSPTVATYTITPRAAAYTGTDDQSVRRHDDGAGRVERRFRRRGHRERGRGNGQRRKLRRGGRRDGGRYHRGFCGRSGCRQLQRDVQRQRRHHAPGDHGHQRGAGERAAGRRDHGCHL